MTNYKLSILIPARNEEFLARTVRSILDVKSDKTEIIIGLDGSWSNPPIEDHPDVTVVYSPISIGQRAITNKCVKLSKAKYVMKLDAHAILSEGFDIELISAGDKLGKGVVQIPILYNLHAFDRVCPSCKHRLYQGPEPINCEKCGTKMVREMIWKPRFNKKSEFYRFDTDLHFQYHGARNKSPDAVGDIVETMSAQGSCFVMLRDDYWRLEIGDEEYGSWGNQGSQVACSAWLSGGKVVTNRKAWYSHLFRTQGGSFGFPYPQSGKQVEHARRRSRDIFFNNKFKEQVLPLSWLIDKFKPLNNHSKDNVPDWHEPDGAKLLEEINQKGEEFYKRNKPLTQGIIYYTDNQLSFKLAHKCRKQLLKANLPIVSTSLKPMDFGKNIWMKMTRGYEAYFRQILTALENSDADIIYFGESDWLYPPSHFDFMPPRKDTFYYDMNWWRVRASDGHAVHYDTQLVPGIVAYRELLIDFYRKVVNHLEKVGFTGDNARKVGFEPGTSKRIELGQYKVEHFKSKDPLLDIRHDRNLTSSKCRRMSSEILVTLKVGLKMITRFRFGERYTKDLTTSFPLFKLP